MPRTQSNSNSSLNPLQMSDSARDSSSEIETKENNDVQQDEAAPSTLNADSEEKESTTDQNGDDAEELLTIQDILDNEESCRQTARVLLGAQDSSVCTYPEGYKPRQALFACLTCASDPEKNEAGICYGCSVHCHEDHNIVELFTKRRFRCDCGNSKFQNKCTLFEEKDESNKENTYNHNFAGLFCVCKKPYPCDEIDETMHQCVVCEDWFHLSHLDENCATEAEEREKAGQQDFTLLCKDCASRLPFFSRLSVNEAADGTVCFSSVTQTKTGPFLLADGFRDRLCRCEECMKLYERVGCEYLLDREDDIEEFTKENIEKTADEKEPDADAIVNEIVQTAGRDAAIHVLQGRNQRSQTKPAELHAGKARGRCRSDHCRAYQILLRQNKAQPYRRGVRRRFLNLFKRTSTTFTICYMNTFCWRSTCGSRSISL
ncbi:putative zinc finger in N-recognin [Trichostrongylus colubriformis]|uniref:Zinc finger in N-recognin n=1 Tax=Trichostrongylus colubriformis TaxID=6319 RepID=A0AAN8F964_TRICO